jgi:aminopeptidase N
MRIAGIAALLVALLAAPPAAAERLPGTAIPEHYDLAFDVDLAAAGFTGVETILVQVPQPTTRIVLHAVEITFRAASIVSAAGTQTARVGLDAAAETATLTVPRAIPAGRAEIRIRYAGILNEQLGGFYLSRANGRRYAISQMEATDARRAFPCFDEPALKATFAVTLTIDRRDTAISNGMLLSDTPGPGADRHTLRFATSPRMSSYLVALAVGDFECLEGRSEGTPIRVCAVPGKRALGRLALEAAEFMLRFYNGYYSIKYPFAKLDLVAVPDFAAGPMENTAAIFFRDTDLLLDSTSPSVDALKNVASTIAHEMAHLWFGDLVTMRWWDDLWLNEGLATWMQNKPLAAWKPDWNMAVDERLDTERALNLDSLNSTRPIHVKVETRAEIDESFDAIAYEKGAAVLRMVESYLGPDTFRRGINAYLEQHAYGNATSEDFWSAVASASGTPVDGILRTFVNQPGVPLITIATRCLENGAWSRSLDQQRFVLDQPRRNPPPVGPWAIPVCVKDSIAPDARCEVFRDPSQSLLTTSQRPPGAGGSLCPAWVFANAGATGYYRTAYSSDMLRALVPVLDTRLTAPERLTLAGDEWALVQAGRHSAADYLTLASGYGREQASGVIGQLAVGLRFVRDYLTTDATRGTYQAFVRALFAPRFAELGIASGAAETDERRRLRSAVIETLGGVADAPAVAAQARDLLRRALAGSARLDPTTADAIVRAAARRGDAALWEALATAAEGANDPSERARYLYALGDFEDPALADRGLEHALTPAVRAQDAGRYLERFLSNPAVNQRAWSFVKRHWNELQPKIGVAFAGVRIVRGLGSLCDVQSRDDVRTFFATHRLGSADRTVEQSLERITNCSELRERQTPVVSRWLQGR